MSCQKRDNHPDSGNRHTRFSGSCALCFAESGTDATRRGDQRMIRVDESLLSREHFKRHARQPPILHRDHTTCASLAKQGHRVTSEYGAQYTIGGDGHTATLRVTEHNVTTFNAGGFFNFVCDKLRDAAESDGIGGSEIDFCNHLFPAERARTFRYRNQR